MPSPLRAPAAMTPEPDLDKLAESYNFDHDRQELVETETAEAIAYGGDFFPTRTPKPPA